MEYTRRRFLGTSAAAVIAAGAMSKSKVFGANDRIRACCIGIHGQGGSHMDDLMGQDDSEVVALCDTDKGVLKRRAKEVKEKTGKEPKMYSDLRDVMADDGIDAVTIATPNHWHSLAAIWACQAGKDVYVEKPLSHNIWEGRQLVEAAKKYGRVVQHGTQRRSEEPWIHAIKAMHDGIIGDLYMARALCFKPRGAIGPIDTPATGDLDWDLWQGPAKAREFSDLYVHYNWHWFWPYGCGDIGNQGVHQMDVAIWGLNKGMPVKIESSGGRYTYDDGADTPNTQTVTFTYEDGTITVFEVRGRYTNDEGGTKVGNLFYGSKGYFVEGLGEKFFDGDNNEVHIEDKEKVDSRGRFGNFLRAVRSRKPEDNFAPPEQGHISAAHCHLANVAYRVGHTIFFDPKTETITKDDEANKLLTREYRGPFVVPDIG